MATSAEEITYEAGRHALAEQEAFVAGIRSRTGTLLAAHALVASFLGASVLHEHGLSVWAWIALASLVGGLVLSARILGSWNFQFSLDPVGLCELLMAEADMEQPLVVAGTAYSDTRESNVPAVARMASMAGALGLLMVVQAIAWNAALVL